MNQEPGYTETRNIQADGRVTAARLAGAKVIVRVGGDIVRHGYVVRPSGHIGVGKDWGGREATIEVIEWGVGPTSTTRK